MVIKMYEDCFETKNFVITELGNGQNGSLSYSVHLKDFTCLDILFEIDNGEVITLMALNQDTSTPRGEGLVDYTHKVASLIENDIIEIVSFIQKYL